jgi:OOP family OmpA-OmpF porin
MRPDLATAKREVAPVEPLELTIGFPDGGSEIPEEGLAQLEKFLTSPQVAQGGPIQLGAHSDSAGTDTANVAASKKRGEAVVNWLVEHGIAKDRLTLVAFGEQNPVKPNALPDGSPDEAGRAANRRVEIHVPVANAPSAEQREPTLAEEIVEETETAPRSPKPTAPGTEKSD